MLAILYTLLLLLLPLLLEVGNASASILRTPRTAGPSLSGRTPQSDVYFITAATSTSTSPVIAAATPTAGPETTTTEDLPPPMGAVFHETASAPTITAAPDPDTAADVNVNEEEKFVQTTYWSCVAFARETHCGWHEPILDTSDGGDRGWGAGGRIAAKAGAVAGLVGGLVVLGL
ncbi:hypothetical protein F4780DRAFT_781076 [Xylariomycetidae sp. FL0641]|nr:hypothetical protein F4780DRAFT_781076 [Xylariomycetidae sp. FL0641]